MTFGQYKCAILAFPNREAAGEALDQLIISGFPLTKVFIVGKELVSSHYDGDIAQRKKLVRPSLSVRFGIGNGLRLGLVTGNVIGGVTGILLGLGVLALPGVSGVMLVSKIVFTLSSGFFCTVSGGMIGALIGLEVVEKQIRDYDRQVARGNYLVVVNGTKDEVSRAKRLLNNFLQRKVNA